MAHEWSWKRLSEVVESCDYGLSCSLSAQPKAIPVLRMGNLQGGKVILDDLKYIDENDLKSSDLLLSPGDILVNRTNSAALVGKVGLFRGPARTTFASYLFRMRTRTEIANPEWVNFVLDSPSYQQRLREIATPGVS